MFDPSTQGLLVPLVYLIVALGLVLLISLRYNRRIGSLFVLGYLSKVVGTIIFIAIYIWYYGTGDTFIYYEASSVFFETFVSDPQLAIDFLFQDGGIHKLNTFELTLRKDYFKTAEWMFIRISAVINFFCFNNFYCLSLIFGSISYLGLWLLYRMFSQRYPGNDYIFFIVILLSPSIFIWTSGLLKDSFCMGFIGLAFLSLDRIRRRQSTWFYVLLLAISLYVISIIKFYLFSFFLLASSIYFAAWLMNSLQAKPWIRWTFFSFSMLGIIGLLYVFNVPDQVEQSTSFRASMERLSAYHIQDENKQGEDNSKYELGEIEYSISGMLGKAPAGFVTSLFRPFPWESRKLMMAFMSFESSLFLLLVVILLLNPKFWRNFRHITANPEIAFCVAFIILLGTTVGITSYNYGLLMRLKAPMMPFFGAAVVVVYSMIYQTGKTELGD